MKNYNTNGTELSKIKILIILKPLIVMNEYSFNKK